MAICLDLKAETLSKGKIFIQVPALSYASSLSVFLNEKRGWAENDEKKKKKKEKRTKLFAGFLRQPFTKCRESPQ
ncbi:CLUMA_CG002334, isoform A [Clunio marinus]|uniref:CLUMA_CG002334, isoform A n=1 Tax=Clunio marinus TaxID=568069 RepID=A0A1J1HK47_9DIPT|nr:CLUMA_CG002334, isoform A [Clunio marinus]